MLQTAKTVYCGFIFLVIGCSAPLTFGKSRYGSSGSSGSRTPSSPSSGSRYGSSSSSGRSPAPARVAAPPPPSRLSPSPSFQKAPAPAPVSRTPAGPSPSPARWGANQNSGRASSPSGTGSRHSGGSPSPPSPTINKSPSGGYFERKNTGSTWGGSASSGQTARAPSGLDGLKGRFSSKTPTSSGVARPNYSPSSSSAMYNRPKVAAPPAANSRPVVVNYSPKYVTVNNYGSRGSSSFGGYGGGSSYGSSRKGFGTGALIATGVAAGIGGYYLGKTMASFSRPSYGYGGGGYGYGGGYGSYGHYGSYIVPGCEMGCSPYQGYVPYRDRYSSQYTNTNTVTNNTTNIINNYYAAPAPPGQAPATPTGPVTPAPKKNVDLCTLARWNRELPFAEMPNMALDFLADDFASGNSTSDKAKFVYEFLSAGVDTYAQYNSSADVFTIPPSYDLKACNIQVSKSSLISNANPGQEEPILTSLRHMMTLYSNKSKDEAVLKDVVNCAKLCLPKPGENITTPEVLVCLDFSLAPEQLMQLEDPKSIFGNSEICKRQLSPDTFKCAPKSGSSSCTLDHLKTLNLFARNFYLCSESDTKG